MSWSFSLSGHSDDSEAEARVIDALKVAARDSGAERGHVSTSYHGGHNLLDADTLTKWVGDSGTDVPKTDSTEAMTAKAKPAAETTKGKSASKN